MTLRRKRRRADEDQDEDLAASPYGANLLGMGAVLAHLKSSDLPPSSTTSSTKTTSVSVPPPAPEDGEEDDAEGWQRVSRRHPAKKPKTHDKGAKNYPSITHSPSARLQSKVKLSDLQGLVLYLLADGTAPQWVSVRHHHAIRKVVVLMVPGLEQGMFDGAIPFEGGDGANAGTSDADAPANTEVPAEVRTQRSPDDYYPTRLSQRALPKPLRALADIFSHLWPVITPGDDKFGRMHSPVLSMLNAPLPKSKEEKRSKGAQTPREARDWENRRTRITEFVATADQLRESAYPLHPAFLTTSTELEEEGRRRQTAFDVPVERWVDTRVEALSTGRVAEAEIERGSVTAGREVLAMDCEMCRTDGDKLELTRVSLVGWDGEVVLDELVKPPTPITDYLTPYSGITKALLDPVQTTLSDVQAMLLDILRPTTILVGHSLNADLIALEMTHPFVVDTSIIFPHPRGPPLKSSLKWLAQRYLGREIQKGHGSSGHDSIEDARACLDLVKQKCERGPLWGTSEASTESIFKRLARAVRPSSHGEEGKCSAVIDWGQPEKVVGGLAQVCIGCVSDDEVVAGVVAVVNGHADGRIVARGGVDFVWARMREVEALRGWWNGNRNSGAAALAFKGAHAVAAATAVPSSGESSSAASEQLSGAVTRLSAQIAQIYDGLPPCTALVVYSGSGDPRDMSRLQAMQQQFRREYQTKKWDELSVQWTDREEQQLRAAVGRARSGLALITVKLDRISPLTVLTYVSTIDWLIGIDRKHVSAPAHCGASSVIHAADTRGQVAVIDSSCLSHPPESAVSADVADSDATTSPEAATDTSALSSADADDSSTIASAISSARASIGSVASHVAESVNEVAGEARSSGAGRVVEPTPSDKIFVGNLPFTTSEEELKTLFGKYGTVLTCNVVRNQQAQSKGMAFLRFPSQEAASKAIEDMSGAIVGGRIVAVQYAINKPFASGSVKPPNNPPSPTLFIGNMSFDLTDEDLTNLFRGVANVTNVRVAIDRRTGQPRGYAHADFLDVDSAKNALEYLSTQRPYGRLLRVDYSAPMQRRHRREKEEEASDEATAESTASS
ncbi:MAG: hypothetical protein M1838_001870 [Thelocarpon superellum]|nr:MAG: hypothetical protein M1838_001870 [Thelocarpon superellum]